MDPFKFKTDAKGNFYEKRTYNPPYLDKLPFSKDGEDECKKTFEVKIKGKLTKPKDTRITKGTVTINKKAQKFEGCTGETKIVGPFEMSPCDNFIELEGTSDKPGEEHIIEVDKA
jgi:hypothetical protein